MSVFISTKLTIEFELLRDLIIVFVSEVGNNQSDVNEKKQKFTFEFLKTFESPPFLLTDQNSPLLLLCKDNC